MSSTSTNVLIGVGGTGAKVVESALYMMLAGLGPKTVYVGLVDQDNANGNGTRTRELINQIITFQKDSASRVDSASPANSGGSALGKVEILPLFEEDGVQWRPTADAHGTLAQILDKPGLDQDRRALLDLLFLDTEEEQHMGLAQGYRGRAHVGAASMLASLELTDTSFKRRMLELMRNGTVSQDLRIFLVGSVFGGTGAAGFPTLARRLDAMRRGPDVPHGSRVRLGGALMLPYFRFADATDPSANVVRTGELMPQARAALDYYHNLFKDEPVFDRLYLAGWNNMFHLNYHSAGDVDQRNPALPPELIGAQAVLDFFETNLSDDLPQTVDIQMSSRAEQDSFSWTDLPVPGASANLRAETYNRIGQMLRTAIYWLYSAQPEMDRRGLTKKIKATWVRDLTEGVTFGPQTDSYRKNLIALFTNVLEWAGSMQLFSTAVDGNRLRFELWNADAIGVFDPSNFGDPVRVHEQMSDAEMRTAFNRMLPSLAGQDQPRSAADLYDEITDVSRRPIEAKHTGLGRMLAAVHNAASPFSSRSAK